MVRIFHEGFSEEVFGQITKEFLYTDLRVMIPPDAVNKMYAYLEQFSSPVTDIVQTYYSTEEPARIDVLTDQLAALIIRICDCLIDLENTLPYRQTFVDFWHEVAAIIKNDVNTIGDLYLRNSCNYFIYEAERIQT